MNIQVPLAYTLQKAQLDEIFIKRLNQLINHYWIEDDNVMTEHVTSHRYDVAVAKVTDPAYAVIVAAYRLKQALNHEEGKKK